MSKNWEHAAGILWSHLVKFAKEEKLPTYSDVAPIIQTNPLSVRNALELIQQYCLDTKLPPLSSIVVGKNSGLPGDGFIAWDVDDIKTAHEKVFIYPWASIDNPFGDFEAQDSIATLSKRLIDNPDNADQVYQKVKARGIAQQVFRSALLKAYNGKCAICELSYKEALEAAHILPWTRCSVSERISPCNGILLCSNHHHLFDSGLIRISVDYEISISNNKSRATKTDNSSVSVYDGKFLILPKESKLKPSKALIEERYGKKH
ncbi:MAG: HNH endonuclease [Pseudomonadales bacterium]|nr:HNH endonuclease [Pseudomonadales bacterium]